MGSYNSNLCCSRVNCIYTMGHYSATRKKDFLPFATTWMDIEGIMLSEISQMQKDILYDLTYMWTLKKSNL